MSQRDLLFTAAFDDQTKQFFDNLNSRIDAMEGKATSATGALSQGAGASAVQMGVLAGAIGGITGKLTEMALQAAQAFPNLIAESTKMAAQAQVTGKALETVAARAGISADEVDKLRKSLIGMNFAQTSVNENLLKMLSSTGDLTQAQALANAAKNTAVVLGRSEEETLSRLTHAIAMETTTVLNDLQANIKLEEVNKRMVQVAKERGVAVDSLNRKAVLTTMVIERLAKFEGASASAQSMAATEANNLEEAIDNLKTSFGALFLPAYLTFLQTMSQLVAELQMWFENNEQTVEDLAGTFQVFAQGAMQALTILIDALKTLPQIIGAASKSLAIYWSNMDVEEANERMENLGITARQTLALIASGLAYLVTGFRELIGISADLIKGIYLIGDAFVKIKSGNFQALKTEMVDGLNSMLQGWDRAADGPEKARQAAEDAFMAVAEGTGLLREAGEEGEDAFDKIAKEAEKAEKDLTGVIEKVKQLNKEFARQAEDVMIRRMRQDIDAAIQESRRREDIARNQGKRIDRIHRDAAKRREALLADLAKEERELAASQQEQRIDLEKSHNDALLNIEIDYQRRLQDIKINYELQAHELARKNDAVGLLRLQRQTKAQLNEAGRDRDRQNEDRQRDYEDRTAQLAQQHAKEREQIAVDRAERMAELEQELNDRLAQAQASHEEELANLERSLERQREDRARHRQWEDEDRARAHARKMNDLGESFAEEQGLTAQHLQTILAEHGGAIQGLDAMWAAFYARQTARAATGFSSTTPSSDRVLEGGGARVSETEAIGREHIEWYQHGGFGITDRPKLIGVGESGPEAFAAMPLNQMVNHRISGSASINVNGVDGQTSDDMRGAMLDILYSLIRSSRGVAA
jgi:hypothetical protein